MCALWRWDSILSQIFVGRVCHLSVILSQAQSSLQVHLQMRETQRPLHGAENSVRRNDRMNVNLRMVSVYLYTVRPSKPGGSAFPSFVVMFFLLFQESAKLYRRIYKTSEGALENPQPSSVLPRTEPSPAPARHRHYFSSLKWPIYPLSMACLTHKCSHCTRKSALLHSAAVRNDVISITFRKNNLSSIWFLYTIQRIVTKENQWNQKMA